MCPYAFYKDNETYYPYLYCKLDGKRCLYSKRCQKEEKYIQTILDNIDSYDGTGIGQKDINR